MHHSHWQSKVLSALTALTCLVSSPLLGLDWPHWRGPDYNGISRESGWSADWPANGPTILWRAKVGIGFSSFAVADNRVYTMGNAGRRENQDSVFCFDAGTGKELWRHTYDEKLDPNYYEGGPSATPTVDGDRVYTISKSGNLRCLSVADGKPFWTSSVPELIQQKIGKEAKMPTWGFAGSVVVQGDRLYVNVGKYGSALDKDGKLIWTTGAEAAGYSSFVPFTVAGQSGLAVFAAEEVAAVDPSTGKLLWSYPWKTSYDVNAADPIINGNEVFISSGYGTGAAVIRIVDGKPQKLWQDKSAMRNQHNNCVLIDGYLYGFDGDRDSDLKCIEFKTGRVVWSEHGLGKGALMAADGKLIINSEAGELVIAPADPSGFKALSRAQVIGKKCWTAPVLANGKIYVRNEKGDVLCVDVSS